MCSWIHVHYLQFQRDWQTTQWASSCGSYQTHIQPAVPRRSWKCWRRPSWVRISSPSLQNSVGSPKLSEKSHCILFPQRGRNKPLWCWWSISSSSTCRLASRGLGAGSGTYSNAVRLAPPLPSAQLVSFYSRGCVHGSSFSRLFSIASCKVSHWQVADIYSKGRFAIVSWRRKSVKLNIIMSIVPMK